MLLSLVSYKHHWVTCGIKIQLITSSLSSLTHNIKLVSLYHCWFYLQYIYSLLTYYHLLMTVLLRLIYDLQLFLFVNCRISYNCSHTDDCWINMKLLVPSSWVFFFKLIIFTIHNSLKIFNSQCLRTAKKWKQTSRRNISR